MKIISIVYLFLLSGLLSAQATHSLSFVVSPDLAFLTKNRILDVKGQVPQLCFHTRLDGDFKISKHWWGRVGLGYAEMRFKYKYNSILQWPSQNNNGQYDPSLSGETEGYKQSMITLPVALRRYWTPHFYSDFELGANLRFLKSYDNNETLYVDPGFGLGLGWEHAISPKCSFFVQPAFRFIFNSRQFNSVVPASEGSHRYTIGIETGLRGFLGR